MSGLGEEDFQHVWEVQYHGRIQAHPFNMCISHSLQLRASVYLRDEEEEVGNLNNEHKDACEKGELLKSAIAEHAWNQLHHPSRGRRLLWQVEGTTCEGDVTHPSLRINAAIRMCGWSYRVAEAHSQNYACVTVPIIHLILWFCIQLQSDTS